MGWAKEHNSHSMTSDWTSQHRSQWNLYQLLIDWNGFYPIIPWKALPVHLKTDKMPYMSPISQHLFIIFYATVPLALHQAYSSLTGLTVGKFSSFLLYGWAYLITAVREMLLLRRLIHKYGCLDGDVHGRDGIPNTGARKVLVGPPKTAFFRLALAVFITYDSDTSPLEAMADVSCWPVSFVKLCLYGITLDLWFYVYHRACHEIPFMWKYHRTHHLSKHPTAAMAAWADDEQEVTELVIIPLLTFATFWSVGLPLGFYEWWICSEYVVFSEVIGHSGIRVHVIIPSPISWLLRLCDAELAIEDHDLHHRFGWRKSFNYGKQTTMWDKIFSSKSPRLESRETNVDYEDIVWMPIF
ncbi:hypothetical protein MY4824_005781 [Beauveria thailandica]